MAVLTVETTSPGFKNLFAYCENNPIIMEDSTGQAGVVIFGVFVGADVLFDWAGLTISVIDLAHNPTDPLAYAGVACDVIDIFFPGCYTGEAVNAVKYSVRYGPDFVMAFISKFGDDAAAIVVKHSDEVVQGGLDALSTPSSRVLRQNLIDAGVKVPDYPNAAHHIVAGSSPKAAQARAILQKYGVDINDAANGTFLPTVKGVAEGAYHPSLHSDSYYRKVTELLSTANSQEDVLDILADIAEQLQNGTF